MYTDKMLRVQYAVFILIEIVSGLSARCMVKVGAKGGASVAYLARCVYNLRREILAFDSYDFAECVLDSRVVTLNEVAVHKLYSEGGFACKRESAQVARSIKRLVPAVPTERAPTNAILRCLGGAGMVFSTVG